MNVLSVGVLWLLHVSLALADWQHRCLDSATRESTLDIQGRLRIKWSYDSDNITMLVTASTRGWVGLGFSPSGAMTSSDIAIGWITHGKIYLKDFFATNNGAPVLDQGQSLEVLGGSENNTHTTICWTRKLNNCDKEDFKITSDSIRVIWAFHDEDPFQLPFTDAHYHGANRGVKSFHLLARTHFKHPENNYETMDILTNNVIIPNNTDTLYWSTHIKISKTKQRIHIVGFEPKFQEGHEDLMHHFLLYECSSHVTDETFKLTDPRGYDSFHPDHIEIRSLCQAVVFLWAVGGQAEFLPEDVGFPFGHEDRETHYVFEMHYNILPKHHGIVDRSGIRIFYTNELKKHEAGSFVVGTDITPFQIIPPQEKEFPNIGICPMECLQKSLPPEGVTVYSLFFHAHMTGRKLRLRRFRNGKELESFVDNSYDFSYQQPVFLTKEFKILPNDTLLMECIYETLDRKNTTVGGFSSLDEMCEVFIYYYPRTDLSFCDSSLNDVDVYHLTDIKEMWAGTNKIKEPSVHSNKSVKNYLEAFQWTEEKRKALRHLYYHGTQQGSCRKLDGTDKILVNYPEIAKVFVQKDECEEKKYK